MRYPQLTTKDTGGGHSVSETDTDRALPSARASARMEAPARTDLHLGTSSYSASAFEEAGPVAVGLPLVECRPTVQACGQSHDLELSSSTDSLPGSLPLGQGSSAGGRYGYSRLA